MPAARIASATPATSGARGQQPQVDVLAAREADNGISVVHVEGDVFAIVAVPPLPGATNSESRRGDFAMAHARACSRPPEPSTKTFKNVPFLDMHKPEHRN